ncbi:STM4015 family protein [Nocardiopsis deserti]|uniref:STM4015 family protein n=1 Tax=Nocardiopsis deserti TaxID=2605988 RepID=UPI00123C34B7|nr:STM4015 family protein [Nocardiopsis deserti]
MPELTEFAGLSVVEFPASGTEEERIKQIRGQGGDPHAPASTAWRLRYDGEVIEEYVARFLSLVDAEQVRALVIGDWDAAAGGPEEFLLSLVEHAGSLPNLRSVFVGDITSDECELSWISQGDVAPLLAAFPRLEELTTKGADGVDGTLQLHVPSHEALRSLTLQSGGLPGRIAREVVSSGLPALEHLELWLGMEDYGGSTTPQDLAPVLSGGVFPRLRYLGVRNAQKLDEWIPALAGAPVVKRVEVLDLSLGCLTDRGGQVLLDRADAFAGLRGLDLLSHHFLSEEMEERLYDEFDGLGVDVDLSDRQEPEEYAESLWYYTAAAE